MTTPNAPEERTVANDLAELHAALRLTPQFFDEFGLNDLPAEERGSLRENLGFIIGRAIVQNCDDKQLQKLEMEVQSKGTYDALRWLYQETPRTFRDTIRAGLIRLVEDLRLRYPEEARPAAAPAISVKQRRAGAANAAFENGAA